MNINIIGCFISESLILQMTFSYVILEIIWVSAGLVLLCSLSEFIVASHGQPLIYLAQVKLICGKTLGFIQ